MSQQQGQTSKENMLAPYRVLDLTDDKGFLCGKLLADLGADVIKVEKPGGDKSRNTGPFYHNIPHPEKSLSWFAYNTGKRGITLNIESGDGQEIFRRLVEKADFVIESFPPGYMDGLGLGYSALSEINPRIIMTSITPFGQDGPYKDYRTSDLVSSAMGGLIYILGEPDRAPVRISSPQAYLFGGVGGAGASLVALWYRHIAGEGQHVDVSIQECVLWSTYYEIPYWGERKLYKRAGNWAPRMEIVYRALFPCRDGYINYRAYGGAMFGPGQANLVKAMDDEGMDVGNLKDVNWRERGIENTPQADIDHFEGKVRQYFKQHTKAELLELSMKWNFMLSPVNTVKDVVAYSQLEERGFWAEIEHPELKDTISYPGFYFKSSAVPQRVKKRAPLIGENNEEIYAQELGFSRQELAILKQNNVI